MSGLSSRPAWPMIPRALPAPIKFDALHCSADNRVRVATRAGAHFVSIDGDNFAGPFKTADAARAYGERTIEERA